MNGRHQQRRAEKLADDLRRSARPVLARGAGIATAPERHELASLMQTVASFASLRSDVKPDPRRASELTGSLLREVRKKRLRAGTPLPVALLNAAARIDSGFVEDEDREAVRLLIRAAQQNTRKQPTSR